MKPNEYLHSMISTLQFRKASCIFRQLTQSEQMDFIILEAAEAANSTILDFLSFLLDENETALYHLLTAMALIQMCWLKDAYQLAYMHACALLKLEPTAEHKEFMLFFFDIPEKILSKEQAFILAKEILLEKPTSIAANRIATKLSE